MTANIPESTSAHARRGRAASRVIAGITRTVHAVVGGLRDTTHEAERIAERIDAALDTLTAAPAGEADRALPEAKETTDPQDRIERYERELAREREAREQAEAASRMKDEFLALASHELRTPLTAILGWARLLSSAAPGAVDQTRALSAIERNAAALARLLGDLSDVSRVVTGKLSLEVRPLDLAAIVAAAVDAVRPDAEEKSLSLDVDLDPRLGPFEGDGGRLSQVCWNLLANAVKLTQPRGRITVRLTELGGEVELKVSDNGQGIAPASLPHVFERLRQADGSSARGAGLDLGLSLVQSIVELHGGSVRATSAGTGKGAVFTVTLPRRHALPVPANDACAEVTLCGVRVLVVDDEQDARELIAALLEMRGAEVRVAASTRDAMEAIGQARPHVILSDLAMPHEDGYELIRRVRALDPDHGGAIPAAALTAYAEPEVGRRARAAGFHEHVAKPVDPQRLAALVADLARRPAPLNGGR